MKKTDMVMTDSDKSCSSSIHHSGSFILQRHPMIDFEKRHIRVLYKQIFFQAKRPNKPLTLKSDKSAAGAFG